MSDLPAWLQLRAAALERPGDDRWVDAVTIRLLREAANALERQGEDSARLDWLETQGQLADNHPTTRVFAIAAHIEWSLREAIDVAREVP